MKTPPLPLPTLGRLAALRDAGESLRAIAKTLEAEGVPPPPRAQGWNHSRVQAALQQLEAWEAEAEGGPEGAAAPAPEAKPKAASPPAKGDIKIQGPCIRSDGLLWQFLSELQVMGLALDCASYSAYHKAKATQRNQVAFAGMAR